MYQQGQGSSRFNNGDQASSGLSHQIDILCLAILVNSFSYSLLAFSAA